jgi:hypothetical protein
MSFPAEGKLNDAQTTVVSPGKLCEASAKPNLIGITIEPAR